MTNQRADQISVLQVTPRYYPESGGIETHVYEVSRRMRQLGVNTTVLTTDRSRVLPAVEQMAGFRVERVPGYPRNHDYYAAPAMWPRIVHCSDDLVHCQGVHTLVPPFAMLAALRSNKPFMLTLHTGGHSSLHRSRMRSAQWRLLAPLLRRADMIVGVSRFETEYFQVITGLSESRVHTISNGGSLPSPSEPVEPNPEAPVVLSIGRLERYKGHQRLIEAMPRVLAARPGARALVLGTGPYENELRTLVVRLGLQQSVEITSVASSDRVGMANRVAGASLVVMFSDYEAHPVAVMEAVTLHRPVLVTGTSGLQEMADNSFATAIPRDSPTEQVAAAILDQLENPHVPPDDVRLQTWDGCAQELADLYRHVLAEARAHRN